MPWLMGFKKTFETLAKPNFLVHYTESLKYESKPQRIISYAWFQLKSQTIIFLISSESKRIISS